MFGTMQLLIVITLQMIELRSKTSTMQKNYPAGIKRKLEINHRVVTKSLLLANDQQNIVEKLERSLNAAPDTHFRDFVKYLF